MTPLPRASIERIQDFAKRQNKNWSVLTVTDELGLPDWGEVRDLATTCLALMDERDTIRDVAAWRGTMLTRYHDLRCSVFSNLPTERALNEGLGIGNDCNCGEQDALVAANAALREQAHDKADLYVETKMLYLKEKTACRTAEARISRLEAALSWAMGYIEYISPSDGPEAAMDADTREGRVDKGEYQKARAILSEPQDGEGGTPDLSKNWTDYSFRHLAEDAPTSPPACPERDSTANTTHSRKRAMLREGERMACGCGPTSPPDPEDAGIVHKRGALIKAEPRPTSPPASPCGAKVGTGAAGCDLPFGHEGYHRIAPTSPPASHDFVAGTWPNEHVCRVCALIPHPNHPDPKYRPTSPPAEPCCSCVKGGWNAACPVHVDAAPDASPPAEPTCWRCRQTITEGIFHRTGRVSAHFPTCPAPAPAEGGRRG